MTSRAKNRLRPLEAPRGLQPDESNRWELLGVLSRSIEHDVRGCLAGVTISSEVLARDPAMIAAHKEDELRALADCARQAMALTEEMVAFIRGDSPNESQLDLSDLLERSRRMFEAMIRGKATIEWALEPMLPEIEAKSCDLKRIAGNLLINAAEALERPSAIRVSTSLIRCDRRHLARMLRAGALSAGDYVCLEISDRGPGLSEENMRKVIAGGFSTRGPGRGQGVGIVRNLVAASRGGIEVKTELGKGTTFRIYFPAI